MFKSIRWRFILVNSLLVFIGIVISGVFIVKSLEIYNLTNIKDRLVNVSNLIIPKLQELKSLEDNRSGVEKTIKAYKDIGLREEVYIFDTDLNVISSSNESIAYKSADFLETSYVIEALKGIRVDKNTIKNNGAKPIMTKNLVLPIYNKETNIITGVVYLRYDLSEVYGSLDKAKQIILQATLLSLAVIILLGFFIANSITVPINELTQKARKMADGDFDQLVDVKSSDEIGKLGEMFNFLTQELKISLSEINNEKNKLEAIINNMEDGLISTDLKGDIIHINPTARKLMKIQNRIKTIEETPLKDIFINKGFGEKGKNGYFELPFDDKVFKVTHVPFRNDSDEIAGLFFVIQDITEQNKLEVMRKEFVANVSHELKTPLTSIKTYAETILDGNIEDEAMKREFLSIVVSETDRMSRLVKALLQLSQYDSQKVSLYMEVYNVVDLAKRVSNKLQAQTKEKSQIIDINASRANISAKYDEDKIEQVLVNIISNSIKYSNEGSVINIDIDEMADGFVRIDVSDKGIGIPEEDISRIFERFYRVDKARSRAHGGTGLGLAIAKEIVESHGGTMTIDSKFDEGTKVSVFIPQKL